jgi:hypothetical protein
MSSASKRQDASGAKAQSKANRQDSKYAKRQS